MDSRPVISRISSAKSELSATKLGDTYNKFVPQYHDDDNATVCDAYQSLVVTCLEKSNRSGGSCNAAFSKWNQCLARECGYMQKESE
jgi:hypothetical protein